MGAAASFDFREQQARARRRTAALVALFLLITVAIAAAAGVVAGLAVAAGVEEAAYSDQTAAGQPVTATDTGVLDLNVALTVGAIVLGVILIAAGVRGLMLGGDGARVARSLGGTEVRRDSSNPAYRRLFNVTEEMSIASGLPMPKVFVIKHERGINAFAAGLRPENAAIGVTHGAVSSLDRAELKGVIAHEYAHIANGDMRLNLRLLAMVFGLVALTVAGRMALQSVMLGGGRRDQRAVAVAMAVGFTLIVLGALGVLFGRILQAAVSRRREYLADATAAQFTRNPEALAGALKKIGALQKAERMNNAHGEEVRHMLFADAVSLRAAGMLATHPPLVDRIRALEPHFDPETDPLWRKPQKEMIRENRAELEQE